MFILKLLVHLQNSPRKQSANAIRDPCQNADPTNSAVPHSKKGCDDNLFQQSFLPNTKQAQWWIPRNSLEETRRNDRMLGEEWNWSSRGWNNEFSVARSLSGILVILSRRIAANGRARLIVFVSLRGRNTADERNRRGRPGEATRIAAAWDPSELTIASLNCLQRVLVHVPESTGGSQPFSKSIDFSWSSEEEREIERALEGKRPTRPAVFARDGWYTRPWLFVVPLVVDARHLRPVSRLSDDRPDTQSPNLSSRREVANSAHCNGDASPTRGADGPKGRKKNHDPLTHPSI